MMLENMLFLAADTMRSRAYAQAIGARNMRLERTLLIRSAKRGLQATPAQAKTDHDLGDVHVPDLSIPLDTTLAEICDRVDVFDADSVNDDGIVETAGASGAKAILYSGFGGEIVKSGLLGLQKPILHLHCGWLPEYRGSTTIYYSYLEKRTVGVSAILLEAAIDTGAIIARQEYVVPPAGIDVDHVFDSAIRADLLCSVLSHWREKGRLPDPLPQSVDGRTYYVIHPVLKHIALNAIHGVK